MLFAWRIDSGTSATSKVREMVEIRNHEIKT